MERRGGRKRSISNDSNNSSYKRAAQTSKRDSFSCKTSEHHVTNTSSLRREFVKKLIKPRVVNLWSVEARDHDRKLSKDQYHHGDLHCNHLNKVKSGNALCQCDTTDDICHGVYPGEDDIMVTSYHYSYRIRVSPDIKQIDKSSTISSKGKVYVFNGFAVASAISLDHITPRQVVYGCHDYTISLERQMLPEFNSEEAIILMDYLFVQLMELYDWVNRFLKPSHWLLLIPIFSCHGDQPDNLCGRSCDHILPVSEILSHLLSSRSVDISKVEGVAAKQRLEGCLVVHTSKYPACLRLERIGRGVVDDNIEPYLMHTIWKNNDKHTSRGRSVGQWEDIWLPLSGWQLTGVHCDVVEHSLLMPQAIHHIRLSHCLVGLADKLLDGFRDLSLLEMSLTHHSYQFQTTCNEDHMITTASNCAPRHIFITSHDQQQQQQLSWRRGYIGVMKAMYDTGTQSGNPYKCVNNERLEFLGDAVIEYLVSIHLYHLFPQLPVGKLSMYRKLLVKNNHLSMCAERASVDKYMLYDHQSPSTHRMAANCVEALIGAVYLEKGLESCQKLLTKLLFWDDEELSNIWINYPPHLFQEYPDGDRHLLESTTVLQSFVQLEEAIGVKFTSLRLLARSLTHPVAGYTYLTGGNYQEMEFLGDACLQLIASHYIYYDFPGHNEGHLTLIRSTIVNNKLLAEVATELGLLNYLYCGDHPAPRMTEKLSADLMESLMAALVLDKGLQFATKLFEVCIFPKLAGALRGRRWLDSKTKLQYAVIHTCKMIGIPTMPPVMKLISTEGPSHKMIFTVGVYFRGQQISSGCGNSNIEAERSAAENALKSSVLILPREMR